MLGPEQRQDFTYAYIKFQPGGAGALTKQPVMFIPVSITKVRIIPKL